MREKDAVLVAGARNHGKQKWRGALPIALGDSVLNVLATSAKGVAETPTKHQSEVFVGLLVVKRVDLRV